MFDSLSQVVSQVVTLESIFFCIAIYALVFVQRKLVEFASKRWFPKFEQSKFWQELLVPLGPLGTGMGLSLAIPQYPYPAMFDSAAAHIIYGLGCGMLSGLVFRLVKKNLSGAIKAITDKVTPAADPTDPSATE